MAARPCHHPQSPPSRNEGGLSIGAQRVWEQMLSWTRAPCYVTKSNVPSVAELKQRLSTTSLKKMQKTIEELDARCVYMPNVRLISSKIDLKAFEIEGTNRSCNYVSRANRIVSNRISALQSEINKCVRKAAHEKNKQLKKKARDKEREASKKRKAKERAKQREGAKKLRAKERARAKKAKKAQRKKDKK
jgi:hypothetical protein